MKLTHIAALPLTGRYLLQPPTFKRSGRSPRTESPFRELGQFQRDFDEVFDQCQQAGWPSGITSRVAHRRRPSRYPCRPALGRSERHPNGGRRPSSISRSAATG